ncbi:MAG: hypothetical protein Kow0060_04270 [Methylohalobius crimeensis]
MRLRHFFGLIVLALLLFLLSLPFLILERQALVDRKPAPAVADADHIHALARRLKRALAAPGAALIRIDEQELHSLMAWLARDIPPLSGRVVVTPLKLDIALTLVLPANPVGRYLNLRAGLMPSHEELQLMPLTLGRLKLPGKMTLWILRHGTDILLGDHQGSTLINTIEAVYLTRDKVIVAIASMPRVRSGLAQLSARLDQIQTRFSPLGDPETIRAYYARLAEIRQREPRQRPASLASYLSPLFQLAQKRAQTGEEAAAENQAAILALALYFGDTRLERILGPVRTGKLLFHQPRRWGVQLAKRHDLMLHFILSAAIKIITDRGMAMAVGELKELLDTSSGGSGYSFADLAADRAGIRFAQAATDPAGGAQRMQKLLAGHADENRFFPDITGLPEGFTKEAFTQRFQSLESPAYRTMVKEIDTRIERLPAYRGRN